MAPVLLAQEREGDLAGSQQFTINSRKDLYYLLLLLGLGIIFWREALAPGNLFFFYDIPSEIVAKKYFWSESGGLMLWSPYGFFGLPYASTPQSEVFYPLNFFFSLFGPERGVVYDIVLHHLFFLLTFYLALRRIGFKEETSLIGSVGFGFSGYLISLTLIPLFLRTVAWLGVLIICLNESLKAKWFRWSLLLGLVVALQVLGGEYQVAGMIWLLALGVVMFAPERRAWSRDFPRVLGVMALGLVVGVILSMPQIALTGELFPLSNRAGGMNPSEGLLWALSPSKLSSLLIPNFVLPLSAGQYWKLGFFNSFSYFFSHYLGVVLLLLVIFSFAGPNKLRVLFWWILAGFGLVMILGNSLSVYPFLYKYLPGLNLFRFPEKFFLFLNFGFVLLAVYGYDFLSGRKWFFPLGSWFCLSAAVIIFLWLLAHPLKIQELGLNYSAVAEDFYRRNILRVSGFFLMGLGLILRVGRMKPGWLALGLGLVLFGDLYFAHHGLNPVTTKDFFRPNLYIWDMQTREKDQIVPPRIFTISPPEQELWLDQMKSPMLFFKDYQNALEGQWAVYFGLNKIWWAGTFYPADVNKYQKLIEETNYPQKDNSYPHRGLLILARSGVKYLYYRDRGFSRILVAFPRAAVYYQARAFSSQDQVIQLWSAPDFPAEQVLLVESGPGGEEAAAGSLKSEPARMVEYQNEKVTVEAEAKEPGWLLLLDSFYPGWKAEVDGHPVEIFRADGFFRAVKIPAGKHQIVFNYRPAILKKSVWISGIGFLIWLGLVVSTGTRGKRKVKAIWRHNQSRKTFRPE